MAPVKVVNSHSETTHTHTKSTHVRSVSEVHANKNNQNTGDKTMKNVVR